MAATLISACSSPSSSWTVDHIATGDRTFDSSRLRYTSQQTHSQLAFEMVKVGDQIEAFLSLTRFRLKSNEGKRILFTVENQSFEERITVHEGGMRLRLSLETTQRLIQALQDGHKIGILLDDFEETVDPDRFSPSFAKFMGGACFPQDLFEGPIQ